MQNITSGLLYTFRTQPIEMTVCYVIKIMCFQNVRFLVALPWGVCKLHSTSSTTMNVDLGWSIIRVILIVSLEICVKWKFTVFPFKRISLSPSLYLSCVIPFSWSFPMLNQHFCLSLILKQNQIQTRNIFRQKMFKTLQEQVKLKVAHA